MVFKVTPGVRKFIIANKIYFEYIVRSYHKDEVEYYVGEQIDWYNSVQSNDEEWVEMHKFMGKSKIQQKDVYTITNIIWDWKRYGVHIPAVTTSKKKTAKTDEIRFVNAREVVPIIKRELDL